MLKTYRYYGPHPFEDLHGFVMEAMTLICNAKPGAEFESAVLKKLPPEFQQLIREEAKNDNDYLYRPLAELFDLIIAEPEDQRALLRKAIDQNNDVEKIAGCKDAGLVTYGDLTNKELANKLKEFLNDLYSVYLKRPAFIKYANLRGAALKFPKDTQVDLMQHFRELMTRSAIDVCPFCGIFPMSNEFSKTRNDYDHFLPKGVVPFVSVNFRNLAPMCDECNSKNKGAHVPVFRQNGKNRKSLQRVRAFYPYASTVPTIEIGMKLKNKAKHWSEWQPDDVDLLFVSGSVEEVESWKETFGIEIRYKAMLLGANRSMIKKVIRLLLQQYKNYKETSPNLTWDTVIKNTLNTFRGELLTDHYFLKYALLKCMVDEAGLLKELKQLAPRGSLN
ncbi:MAG TPA: hypothetical protein VG101_10105 [Puia sp.]|nr:hypothetical protein [Puia sp.]